MKIRPIQRPQDDRIWLRWRGSYRRYQPLLAPRKASILQRTSDVRGDMD